jgi:hypothetical protein
MAEVKKTLEDVVTAVVRTLQRIMVGDCAITVSAAPPTSLATADAMVQYEGMRIDEMDIELGDVITILRGDPMMYFGAFVYDQVVYVATILAGHEANVCLQPLHAPTGVQRRDDAAAATVVSSVDRAKAATALAKLKQPGFVTRKLQRLARQLAASKKEPAIKTEPAIIKKEPAIKKSKAAPFLTE